MQYYCEKRIPKESIEYAKKMTMYDLLILYKLVTKQLLRYIEELISQLDAKKSTSFALKKRIRNKGLDLQVISKIFREKRSVLIRSKEKEKAGRK